MPVTSATTERSFSVLKLIKTYLRSTMVENRLIGLSLTHVDPERTPLILTRLLQLLQRMKTRIQLNTLQDFKVLTKSVYPIQRKNDVIFVL